MDIRAKQKTPRVRRLSDRRVQQIQGQPDQTVQDIEALISGLQTTLDTYRHTRSEWTRRLIRSDIYSGSRALIRPIYHSLPSELFPSEWLQFI